MSKLYLKQKLFSWRDRSIVKDETEADRYQVEGEIISVGKKLHIRDMYGTEVAFIQQKVLTLLPKFFVYINGNQVAEIKKKLSFRPRYEIGGLGWEVNGNYMEHEYTISRQGREIARLHKAWFSWGDSYEITIADGIDEVLVLAVVLAIDCVMDAQEAAAASSAGN